MRLVGLNTKEEEQLLEVKSQKAVGLGTSRLMATWMGDPIDLTTKGLIFILYLVVGTKTFRVINWMSL